MAWRETARSAALPVRRTYACDECGNRWKVQCEANDPVPDCPQCAMIPAQVFEPVALLGVKSKAIDVAQKMAEETYGLTDFNDNSRQGDVAAKAPPPIQGAEAEAITRAMVDAKMTTEAQAEATKSQVQSFWQGGGTGPLNPQAAMAIGRQATAESKAINAGDPISLLHESGKRGLDPMRRPDVVARAKMDATA